MAGEPTVVANINSGTSTKPAKLIITIEADTKEHAEEHGDELQRQGCSCQSTGETTVECDCTGVQ
jgi:hypothetical protein